MRVHLQYGTQGLEAEIPAPNVEVVAPRFIEGLPDEAAAFTAAVREPIESPPLREIIGARERVAVVILKNDP